MTAVCTCGEDIDPRRSALGYRVCIWCGDESARQERKGWTVVMEYGKGNYQFITPAAASVTLRQTNPKESRV